MRFDLAALPCQLGFGHRPANPRLAWAIVAVVLALYAASFALFYPRITTNIDEASYIRQARLFSVGTSLMPMIEPISGRQLVYLSGAYPVGTALLMTPFIWLAGWQGAFVSPMLCLVLGVLVTARWIYEEGRSPIFALLVLGFPAALVLGRVALSDVPSLAVVALGLWLFWRGLDRGAAWWLAAGLVAGGSLVFREANVLPFIPFFAGAVLRREPKAWALVVGGCAGVALRLLSAHLAFGDPFFYKASSAVFGRNSLADTVPLQLLGLLVFVPGGLVAALCYRGRRRPELLVSVALFVLFYLAYRYGAAESGPAKRLVLGLRFYLPLLPLLAFAMAESVPRLWQALLASRPEARRRALQRLTGVALALWLAGVAGAALLVHPVFERWSGGQAEIAEEIQRNLGYDSVFITNLPATRKFLTGVYPRYLPLNRSEIERRHVDVLVRQYPEFFVVLLDRTDSAYWREDARLNEVFVRSLEPAPVLQLDRSFSATDRLRIWRVSRGARR